MGINSEDGRFGLDCWVDADSDGEPDQELFADDLDELKAEARRLLADGKFGYLILSQWDDDEADWIEVEIFEA